MASRFLFANPRQMAAAPFSPPTNSEQTTGPRQLANRLGSTLQNQTEVFSSLYIQSAEYLANASGGVEFTPDVTANDLMRWDSFHQSSPEVLKRFPIGDLPKVSFRPLQLWEGVVLEVGPESFVARLTDSQNKHIVEEAEIDLEEISPEDRELVREGAAFYWKIEYQDRYGGRQRASNLRFRRLPSWTPAQIDAARQEATRVRQLIGWE